MAKSVQARTVRSYTVGNDDEYVGGKPAGVSLNAGGEVGNLVISAGWGTGATATIKGNLNRFRVTIVAATTPGANPNFTVDFVREAVPAKVYMAQESGAPALTPRIGTLTSTQLQVLAVGTPIDGTTYVFDVEIRG